MNGWYSLAVHEWWWRAVLMVSNCTFQALELLNEAIVRCRKLGSDVAADVKALMQVSVHRVPVWFGPR